MSKKIKAEKLGMNPSTAAHRLRKIIIFELAKRLDMDFCYQCGEKIHNIEDFSIEHKIAWLNSENPKELFFDIENIAFSHLHCNCKNKGKKQNNVTCKGVRLNGRMITNPYQARYVKDGERIHIGNYPTKEQAMIAYDEYAISIEGSNAVTNVKLGNI